MSRKVNKTKQNLSGTFHYNEPYGESQPKVGAFSTLKCAKEGYRIVSRVQEVGCEPNR